MNNPPYTQTERDLLRRLAARVAEIAASAANIENIRLARMAAQLGRDYVYCRKPLPTLVCGPTFDEEGIRADLRATLTVAGHLNLQIILKDTHTVHHEPGRIGRWVQLAREELFRYQEGVS